MREIKRNGLIFTGFTGMHINNLQIMTALNPIPVHNCQKIVLTTYYFSKSQADNILLLYIDLYIIMS